MGMPRKSALKSSNSKLDATASTFRTLPRGPPMHGMIQGGLSMSINPNTLTSNQLPAVPPHQSQQQQPQSSHASQTLPLKSNLKKSSSAAAGAQSSSGSQHQ